MTDFLKRANELFPEMKRVQETIHKFAGVSFDLRQSADFIKSELTKMGIEPQEVCECGIAATIGEGEKTILLRADFDALPITEQTGLPYANESGSMHACGHDHHSTMLLFAAKLLKEKESELTGKVKLMFQPAEETLSGAAAMIKGGILNNPKVDAALAMHVDVGAERSKAGKLYYSVGPAYAACDAFTVTVKGKGGHGAIPSGTVDPITAAAKIIGATQQIIAYEVLSTQSVTITYGQINAGTALNIIPDEAVMRGTIRTFSDDVREFVLRRFKEVCELTAASMRATAEVVFADSFVPSVVNDEKMAVWALPILKDLLGSENVYSKSEPLVFYSEDFSLITKAVPSLMMSIGAGSTGDGYLYPVHTPKTTFDPRVMPCGSAVFATLALNWLKENSKK